MLLTLNLAGISVSVIFRMVLLADAGFEVCRLSIMGVVSENEAAGTILAVMVVIAVADDPELAAVATD